MQNFKSWGEAISTVLKLPLHKEIVIPAENLPHPKLIGFRETKLGIKKGAKKQYRLKLPDGKSLHLLEYKGYYTLHWDKRDPRENPIAHLTADFPELLIVATGILILINAIIVL